MGTKSTLEKLMRLDTIVYIAELADARGCTIALCKPIAGSSSKTLTL